MKPIERYRAVLSGEMPDHAPRIPILMGFAAREIGISYADFASDYRHLVTANLACARRYGLDQVSTISDPYRETTGFGAEVAFQPDGPPHLLAPPLQFDPDLSRLQEPDPRKSPRMRDRLDAVRLYRTETEGEFSILGWVEGPAAEAADLRGVVEFLVDLMDEPEFAAELMDRCLDVAIDFALAQIEAGADTIGIGDAIASQTGPDVYAELILPREKRLVQAIHDAGAATRLHICGNIVHLLPHIAELGVSIVDIDWQVDGTVARQHLGRETVLAGFLDPVSVVSAQTPRAIRKKLGEAYRQVGDPFMVAAGCEIPSTTPPENLLALCGPLHPLQEQH